MILLNDFKGGKKYPSRRAQVLKEDDAVFVELTEFWGMESNHKGWFKKWRPMGLSLIHI